jgi:hypothetical protein
LSASSGEYTKRTSDPRALASSSDPSLPGTRIMSPKVVRLAHLLHGVEGGGGLAFVDLRHGEADVDEDPVTDIEPGVGEQPDADRPSDPVDVYLGQVGVRVGQLDYLAGDSQAHELLLRWSC